MTQRLADATAVPVHLVDTPLECVVHGAGLAWSPSTGCSRSSPSTTELGASRSAASARRAARPPPGGPASRGLRRHRRKRGLDRGVVERGQGHGRPPAHRRLVVERVEHGGQAAPDRRWRPARPLPPPDSGCRRARVQCAASAAHGRRQPALAEEAGGADDDQRVRVVQGAVERRGSVERRPCPRTVERQLGGAATHQRVIGRARARDDVGHLRRPMRANAPSAAARTAGSAIASPGGPCPGRRGARREDRAAAAAAAPRLAAGSMAGSSVTDPSMSDIYTTAAGEASPPLPPRPRRPGTRPRPWRIALTTLVYRPGRVRLGLVVAIMPHPAQRLRAHPGRRQDVAPFIKVPTASGHPITGSILLTDVYVTAQPAQLPATASSTPTTRSCPPTSSRAGRPDQPVQRPGLPRDGPGPGRGHGIGADAPRLPGDRARRGRARLRHPGQVTGVEALQVAQIMTAVDGTPTPTVRAHRHDARAAPGDDGDARWSSPR